MPTPASWPPASVIAGPASSRRYSANMRKLALKFHVAVAARLVPAGLALSLAGDLGDSGILFEMPATFTRATSFDRQNYK